MTWVDPETRQTGDLITAAIWNQDVVDNTEALRDRPLPDYLNASGDTGSMSQTGWQDVVPWIRESGGGGRQVQFSGRVPDTFSELTEVIVLLYTVNAGTLNYDIEVGYGQAGQDVDTHVSTAYSQTLVMAANTVTELDVSARFASLAAGDVFGLWLDGNSGCNGTWVLGLQFRQSIEA